WRCRTSAVECSRTKRCYSPPSAPAVLQHAVRSGRRSSSERVERLAMRPSGMIACAIAAAVIAITIPVAGGAQQTLKIFDAHLRKLLENKRFVLTASDTL